MIRDKLTIKAQWRKESIFHKCYSSNCMSTCRVKQIDLCLSHNTISNPKKKNQRPQYRTTYIEPLGREIGE